MDGWFSGRMIQTGIFISFGFVFGMKLRSHIVKLIIPVTVKTLCFLCACFILGLHKHVGQLYGGWFVFAAYCHNHH